MAREIKFRIWNVATGEWAENSNYLYISSDGSIWNWFSPIGGNPYLQRHTNGFYIVEQYTGLKDRNGNEIYEGDIVREAGFPETLRYAVEWDDKHYGWAPFLTGNGCGCCETYVNSGDSEVIGNIHENPELLKGA